MSAVISGPGLGLERGSAALLGSAGQLGDPAVGEANDKVFVNAASGNLVVQATDQILLGVGLNDVIARTYNSQGTISDNNGALWSDAASRHVIVSSLTGTVNTANSTIQRVAADGSVVTYAYSASTGQYAANEGGGAYDTLTFNAGTGYWTWVDGATRTTDVYDSNHAGRIVSSTDKNGNALTYTYNGTTGLLTTVTTADGESTTFSYNASNLMTSALTTLSGAITSTQEYYSYDGQGRLTTVTTDLTPADNSISDSATYVTNYGYLGSTNQLASISQSDGSLLQVGYSGAAATSLTQTLSAGVSTGTTLSYAAGSTTVTDANNDRSTFGYAASGPLAGELTSFTDAAGQTSSFTYDAMGDVLTTTLPNGDVATSTYDANGNLLSQVDSLGNTTSWTYNSANQVLTKTVYATPAIGSTPASQPMTTNYVYDTHNNLVYTVTPDAEVTQYVYNSSGEQTSVIQYGAPNTSTNLTQATLNSWVTGLGNLSNTTRTDTTYDVRGDVATITTYASVQSNGLGGAVASQVNYAYNSSGRLLSQRTTGFNTSKTNAYDGLGRITSSTDANGATTTYAYANNSTGAVTTATLANSTVLTSQDNLAGELLTSTETGANIATATTSYRYNSLGQVSAKTDATGVTTYFFYDTDGRKVADILADGSVTQYVYNANSQIIETIQYANRLSASQISPLAARAAYSAPLNLSNFVPNGSTADQVNYSIYDLAGRLAESIDAAGEATVYSYDGASRLVSKTAYATRIAASVMSAYSTAVTPNLWATPQAGANWATWGTGGAVATGVINGSNAFKFSASAAGSAGAAAVVSNTWAAVNAGGAVTSTVTLQAVGSVTSDGFGVVGNSSGWGPNANSTAVISSGPGTLTQVAGGLWTISGLSTTQPTTVTITRTFPSTDIAEGVVYVGYPNAVSAGDSVIVAAPSLTTTTTANVLGDLTTATTTGINAPVAAGTINGSSAFSYTANTSGAAGTMPAVIWQRPIGVAAGATVTSTITVKAVGSVTTAGFGIEGSSITNWWGSNTNSTATISSGPGTLTQILGGLWSISGLSTTTPTTVTVTRTYTAADIANPNIFIDYPNAVNVGDTLIVAAPSETVSYNSPTSLLLPTTPNLWATPQAGANWATWGTGGAVAAGVINGSNAFKFSASAAGPAANAAVASNTWAAVNAGGVATSTITLQAVGSVTSDGFGVVGNSSGWGPNANSTAVISSGPGTLTQVAGGLWTISGLSTTQPTTVTVTRTFPSADVAAALVYVGYPNAVSVGDSVIVAAPSLTTTTTANVLGDLTVATTTGINAPAAAGTINGSSAFSYTANTSGAAGTMPAVIWQRPIGVAAGATVTSTITVKAVGSVTTAGFGIEGSSITNWWGSNTNSTATISSGPGTLTQILGGLWSISGLSTTTPTTVTVTRTYTAADIANPNIFIDYPNAVNVGDTLIVAAPSETVSVSALLPPAANPATDQTTAYSYNNDGQLTQVVANAGGQNLTSTKTYDGFGDVVAVSDPNGAVTRYVYDAAGRRIYTIDPAGDVAYTTYNAQNNVASTTAYANPIAANTLATLPVQVSAATIAGDVTASTSNDITTSYVYDADGRLSQKVVNPAGLALTSANTYDALGEVVAVTDPLGNVTRYAYDGAGRRIYGIDPNGDVTQTSYDAAGRVTTTHVYATPLTASQLSPLTPSAMAAMSQTALTAAVAALIGASSSDIVTAYVYDADGRLSQTVVNPGGLALTTTKTYDAVGDVVAVTDPNGKITRYVYDAEGRRIYVVDADGAVTQTTYDAFGQVVATWAFATQIGSGVLAALPLAVSAATISSNVAISPNDEVNSFVYDGAGRLRYSVDAARRPTEYDYDADGHVVQTIDYTGSIAPSSYTVASVQGAVAGLPASRVSRSVYNAAGERAYSINADGDVTGYAYDAFGNVVQQRRYATLYGTTPGVVSLATMQSWAAANASTNDRTSFAVYDAANRLVYAINAASDLTQTTFYDVTQTVYDADGHVVATRAYATALTSSQLSALPTVGAAAAVAADLTSTAADEITRYAYDAGGRLIYTVDALGNVTQFAYDGEGHVVATRAYATPIAPSTFSNLPLAVSAAAIAGYVTSVPASDEITRSVYDAAGRQIYTINAVGAVTQTSYDGDGRVTSTRVYANAIAPTTFANLPLAVSAATVAADIGATSNDEVTSYAYDAAGRLLTKTDPAGGVTRYQYDAFGNQVTLTDPRGGVGYFYYDRLNRLVLQIDPDGYATATQYSIGNQITQVTRYANVTTGATISSRPTITTSADDETTSIGRDNIDWITSNTDAMGFTESYTLNAFGDRVSVTNKLGGVTTNTYDKRGLLLSEVLPINSVRADGSVEAASVTNTYAYDAFGNRTQKVEAAGLTEQRTTNYGYDKNNRLTQTIGDAVQTVAQGTVHPTQTNVYDSHGNLIEADDANGARTLYYYDPLNRKIAQVDALGGLTTWTYDANNNALTQTVYGDFVSLPASPGGAPPSPVNANNYRQTSYGYDLDNRLTSTTIANLRTGAYNGSSYVTSVGAVTTHNVYDASGDLVQQIDGLGNSLYTYYDPLGRKIGQVDQANYLTVWALDQDGNVLTETRYATALAAGFSTTTRPTQSADLAHDRITGFTYDKNGRRLTETRSNVASYTVNATTGALNAGGTSATITYTYNGLGEVTSKTEAAGDQTTYAYDAGGRQGGVTGPAYTDFNGATVQQQTLNSYDGLGDLTRTTVGNVGAPTRITTNSYGAGGRLASVTDATGFTKTNAYDAAGHLMSQQYGRLKSNGTVETDGVFYKYDALGRESSQYTGVLNGTTWTYGDTTDDYYDAYGEMIARGTNTGGNIANAQEFANYDASGRVWRTDFNDGITKAYVYDADGDATLLFQSLGADDLKAKADLNAVFADSSGGLTQTISVFDKRNQLTDTLQPTSNNGGANPIHAVEDTSSGSGAQYFNSSANVVSGANAIPTGATGSTISSVSNVTANKSGTFTLSATLLGRGMGVSQIGVTLSDSSLGTVNGNNNIHVIFVMNGVTTDLGTIQPGSTQFYYGPEIPQLGYTKYSPERFTVSILQDLLPSGGPQVLLAQFSSYPSYAFSTSVNPTLQIQNENPNATALRMFVRPHGSNGAYSEINASPLLSSTSAVVAGWFTYDLTQPPFNGAPANSQWDIQYVAMDAAGNIYDSKAGTLSVDANGNPTTSFSSVPVGGPGQAMLTHDGADYLILSGLPSNVASASIRYRTLGGNGAWSTPQALGNGGYGQTGLWALNVNGYGGPIEYWVEMKDSNGALLPNKLYGQFTVGGQASGLTQYAVGSRAIQLNPPAGQTVTNQQFRYYANGAWSSWITYGAGGTWTYDAAALADFYSDQSYPIQYETYNGSTLVSHADATLTLGYDGQSITNITNTQSVNAKVLFNPPQTPAPAYLTLYWRDQGSTGAFTAATVANVGGVFAWDVDAAHVRPPSGSRNLEYYYDAYDSNNTLLAPLNGDQHVHGYLSIQSNLYTQTSDQQIRWVIDAKTNSQFLIHRKQAYNAFGEIISETNGDGATTNLTYNTLGKLTSKVSPQVAVTNEAGVTTLANPTEYDYYDLSGRLVGQQDANGNVMTQTLLAGSGYEGAAALTLVEFHPDGGKKQTAYDVFGDARKLTNEIGTVTTNTYDAADRLTEVDHPTNVGGNSPGLQLIDYYSYDGLGERIKHTNNVFGASVAETTDYDAQGRVVNTATFGGLATAYSYTWVSIATNLLSTTGLGNFGGWQTKTTTAAGLTSYDNKDLFGRLVWHRDLGGHTYFYGFNLAGQLISQTNTMGQSISFTYDANGYIASTTDNALHMKSTFEYDNDGNRTLETYNSTDAAPLFFQNAVVSYDALGRVTEFKDVKADITYQYDANGNRREVKSVYSDGVGGQLQTQDYWYKYDSMNRFVLTMGTLSNSAIVTGGAGVAITYDAAGERKTATGVDGSTETYSYTADGYLENTSIGGYVAARRTNDALGRVTSYAEYLSNSTTVNLTRAMTYDQNNRVTDETDQSYTNGSLTNTNTIHNDYKAYAGSTYSGADQGVITHSQSTSSPSGITTNTGYFYTWWDEAKEASIKINASDPSNPNSGNWAPGRSQLSYDVNGHLTQLVDTANNQVLTYQNDAYGQVLVREQRDNGVLGPRQLYYYFDGHRIGDVGNNGPNPLLVDYAQQLVADQGKAADKGGFRFGHPVASADFDENYQPINASYPGQAATAYTVHAGDTLRSIAQAVWGDASLWYLIADANGLGASTGLVAGQTLSIPNKVANVHNTSTTFRPYNPGEAIGDTLPTLPAEPAPPHHSGGCGVIGEILMAVVAIVVTVVTYGALAGAGGTLFGGAGTLGGSLTAFGAGIGNTVGAALGVSTLAGTALGTTIGTLAVAGAVGSVVSQGFGLVTGIQSKFNWAGVALGAISGAVGAGLSGVTGALDGFVGGAGSFGAGLVNGALDEAVTQGIGVATGLQHSFSWTNVAVAGIEGGIGEGVGHVLGADAQGRFPGNPVGAILTGAAKLIAGAATESALSRRDFGQSLQDQLPGAVGQTVGNLIASGETASQLNGFVPASQIPTVTANFGPTATLAAPIAPNPAGFVSAADQSAVLNGINWGSSAGASAGGWYGLNADNIFTMHLDVAGFSNSAAQMQSTLAIAAQENHAINEARISAASDYLWNHSSDPVPSYRSATSTFDGSSIGPLSSSSSLLIAYDIRAQEAVNTWEAGSASFGQQSVLNSGGQNFSLGIQGALKYVESIGQAASIAITGSLDLVGALANGEGTWPSLATRQDTNRVMIPLSLAGAAFDPELVAAKSEFELSVLGGSKTLTTPSGHIIDIPEPVSLTNVEARDWYVTHDAAIPDYLNADVGLQAQAQDAWGLRNAFRTGSRMSMIDQDLAAHLNATRPNLTWSQTVTKYGSDWQAIINASQRSNAAVNAALGVQHPGGH